LNPLERTLLAAQGYFELQMFAEAVARLDELPLPAQTRSDVLEMRILILMTESRWADALAASETLCAAVPEEPAGFIHRAYCLHEMGCTAGARDLLMAGPPALQRDPTFHYNLACYECVLGNLDTARRHLERSLAMDAALGDVARNDPDLQRLREA
jgi:predicted Zn-dependent protease